MATYLVGARSSTHSQFEDGTEKPKTTIQGSGIVDISSNHSVDQTVERLKRILEAQRVSLFALVDHSGEAEKVEMKMRPTKLLIFGSPKAGTPIMLAAPSIAIDLPLKILTWEDSQGKAWVSYNSPEVYSVAFNPEHRWFYFPRMERDEALLLKCYDSSLDGRARWTAHTAFDDPTSPADPVPRESIEARTIAFFAPEK